MELLDFINSHISDWEQILVNEPYFLVIKKLFPYYLLMYDQTRSDMSSIIVQQARGTIIRSLPNDNRYTVVCAHI